MMKKEREKKEKHRKQGGGGYTMSRQSETVVSG
jgi:hypothetical protein